MKQVEAMAKEAVDILKEEESAERRSERVLGFERIRAIFNEEIPQGS